MTFPQASTAYRTFGRAAFRRVGTQTRTQAWRQATRRHYASGPAKKSSDLPWMIGSAAFTIPAAVWLIGQGPKKSDHHSDHGHGHAEEEAEPAEEESEAKEEEAPTGEDEDKSGEEKESTEEKPEQPEADSKDKKDDKKDDKEDDKEDDKGDDKGDDKKDTKDDDKEKESKEESKDDKKDESKEEKSDDSSSDGGDDKGTPDTSDDEDNKLDGYEKPGANAPGQINYKPGSGKGPGEGQKGPRKPTETKAEKDSAGDKSGAKNPYLDDDEKSKKGVGVKDTAKIHGTVDPNQPIR